MIKTADECIAAGELMIAYGKEWKKTGQQSTVEYLSVYDRPSNGWHLGIPSWQWYDYSYRAAAKLVPFTPDDITTAMQFRRKGTLDWFVPVSATTTGVHLFNHGLIKYDLLLEDYECRHFNQSEADWKPCGKAAP